MSDPTPDDVARPDDPDGARRRILERVAHYASPGGCGQPRCEVVHSSQERWSEVMHIRAHTVTGTEDVFVKRVPDVARRRAAAVEPRPRLKPFVGFDDRVEREAEALRRIETMVDRAADSHLFAVRVLPIPTEGDAVFLAHVPHPTLADLLRHRRDAADEDRVLAACRGAGTWLRLLHETSVGPQQGSLLGTREELREVSTALLDHVSSRVSPSAATFAPALRRLVDHVPESLALRPAHADFAAHNVFVDESAAVAVFDTALDWCMPPHYDLAYFSVMLDFADLRRSRPHVRARPTADLRAALLDGYGPLAPPEAELRAFEAAIILEKWSNLSDGRRGPVVRRAAKAARSALLQRRLRRALGGLLTH